MSTTPHPLKISALPSALAMFVHDQRDQHVSRSIEQQGVWEAYETQLVVERLKPGDTFVDVGANIGYYSLVASRLVGAQGRVYSFEPDPENFALLKKNLHHNQADNVHCYHAALSERASRGYLYVSENNFGDHQIYDDGSGRDCRQIQLLNGADVLAGVDTISLVKIDTQGAEYQVLKGLMPLLKQQRSSLSMIVEFWPYGLAKSGASAADLLALMSELDLPFSVIDHIGHRLKPCTLAELEQWVAMMADHPDDQGFMNILVGP